MLAGDRPVDASTTFRMRLAVHSPHELKYYSDSRHNWEVPVIELKVRKVGNSLGVVLPKEVVSRLQTQEGATLFLSEMRWSRKTGQGFKVGSPLMKDGPDDWQTQAVLG